MKKTFITIIAILSFSIAKAQTNNVKKIDTIDITSKADSSRDIFTAIQSEAQYPGGPQEFLTYIVRNLKISPSEFVRGVVFVRFVVDVDGHIKDATIVKGRFTDGMKNKILTVFNESPIWKPAIQNEKPIRIMYTIPLNLDY
jgi:protein TonB